MGLKVLTLSLRANRQAGLFPPPQGRIPCTAALMVVTRNVRDFVAFEVDTLNPFEKERASE
jgi:hypothetical protein